MIKSNIDYLVLGCTHYPFLIPQIKKITPNHIFIIDSGEAVAKQTLKRLKKQQLEAKSNTNEKWLFYSNIDVTVLQTLLPAGLNAKKIEF